MAVVLVTGSSSGIGLATALHFARLGHDVYAGVRNPATAGELTAAIAADTLPIRTVGLDVDDDASVTRGVAEVLAASGRVDVLVNNAGIGGGGPLADVPVDFARALFETNYVGAIRMIQAVVPAMRAQRGGAIVNISSVWGRVAVAGHGHYCAAKHALEAASEALAQEVYAFGIRVAIVEPGVVIHEAATASAPRLRHIVGEDARRMIDGRGRVSDEDYAATGREMSEEEFLALNRERYGFGR